MFDFSSYEGHLKRFREAIKQDGLAKFQERRASGAIANPQKVRAADQAIREALEEAERDRRSGVVFITLPPPTRSEKLRAWLRAVWHDPVGSKVIGGIILAIGGFIIAQLWRALS